MLKWFEKLVELFRTFCEIILRLAPFQAIVAPENWSGKKGKLLKRLLAEAHDSAIILINPTDPDRFLRVRYIFCLGFIDL